MFQVARIYRKASRCLTMLVPGLPLTDCRTETNALRPLSQRPIETSALAVYTKGKVKTSTAVAERPTVDRRRQQRRADGESSFRKGTTICVKEGEYGVGAQSSDVFTPTGGYGLAWSASRTCHRSSVNTDMLADMRTLPIRTSKPQRSLCCCNIHINKGVDASQYFLPPSPHLSHPTTFNTLFNINASTLLSLVFLDTSSRQTSTLDWASAHQRISLCMFSVNP